MTPGTGTRIKTKHGMGRIIKLLPKPNKYFPFESWEVKLDNPGRDLMGGTCWIGGKKTVFEPGILRLFKSEFEILEYKQGDLF